MIEFLCESLGKQHDRAGFHCGVPELHQWLQHRARQDQERHVAAVYVLVPTGEPARIAGFYTLSATSISLADLPETFARKLPRYPQVPAILIGRLARGSDFPGLGERLLMDALNRASRHSIEIAAAAVVVDAKDERAANFYRRFGFDVVAGAPNRLFLPISTIGRLFKR